MSRSFKKVPGIVDRNPYAKNQANRKVRHSTLDLLMSGSMYKKLYCSYNICDFKFLYYWADGYFDNWGNKWRFERK